MTWEELVRMEPTLEALYQEAPKRQWFGMDGLKNEMARHVGLFRKRDGDPFLFTSQAYDLAYVTLYKRAKK